MPSQGIMIASLPNLRDIGGHATRDGGRIRTGLAYRSTDLSRLDGGDTVALARLGIRTVYDLRTAGEREAGPDRLPPGAAYVVADVIRDSPSLRPADFADVFESPERAEEALGGGRAAAFFVDRYREFVHLESARAAYHRLFADLASGEHSPALIHCTTGKDRTGWAAAALLLLLDVPGNAVMEEYLLSNRFLAPLSQPWLDQFEARGGDLELLRPLMEVRPAYLESGLDEMRRTFGTIERYFGEALGIDAATRAALRTMFVERV